MTNMSGRLAEDRSIPVFSLRTTSGEAHVRRNCRSTAATTSFIAGSVVAIPDAPFRLGRADVSAKRGFPGNPSVLMLTRDFRAPPVATSLTFANAPGPDATRPPRIRPDGPESTLSRHTSPTGESPLRRRRARPPEWPYWAQSGHRFPEPNAAAFPLLMAAAVPAPQRTVRHRLPFRHHSLAQAPPLC